MVNKQAKENLKRVEFALRIKRDYKKGKVLLTKEGLKELESILKNV